MNEKVAIITGASRGIGKAIAKKLSSDGFRVLLIARNKDPLLNLAAELGDSDPEKVSFPCDLSNPEEVKLLINNIRNAFPNIHTLVNNAGYGGPYARLDEMTNTHWDTVCNININSAACLIKFILPIMRESGNGRIINISSILGLYGGSMSSAYSASKHAIIGLTKSIAAEWGKYGITCNAICPGYIDTEMNATCDGKTAVDKILKRIPAGRLGRPEEIASMVSFLAGENASYINGTTCVIDGGLTAHINEID